MTSYRDHPLAFLATRCSVAGLTRRADTWDRQRLRIEGVDVTGRLRAAATMIGHLREPLEKISVALEAENPSLAIDLVARLDEDPDALAVADASWTAGQAIRTSGVDPHGGSTASHLEMASDEIRRLLSAVDVLRTTRSVATLDEIRAVAFEATERDGPPEATHDAPRATM